MGGSNIRGKANNPNNPESAPKTKSLRKREFLGDFMKSGQELGCLGCGIIYNINSHLLIELSLSCFKNII